MKDLSIIFVAYKSRDYVEKCLKDVLVCIKGMDAEIFFVDNASPTNDWEIVQEKFPSVKIIKNINNGFAGGNNVAMKKAQGRYILLLNLDTEIFDKNIFKEMIAWMYTHPKTGISSSALLNPDGTYQGNGGFSPTFFRVFSWMFFLDDLPFIDRLIKPYHPLHSWSFYKGESYFAKSRKLDWVTGAYFLIRKEVINDIGYIDEDYFAYVEETDFCYRAVKAGWEIDYLPKWKITHYGQVSAGSEYALNSEYKNIQLFYKKHMPSWQLPFVRFFLRAGALLRVIIFFVLKGPKVANVYVKAFKSV
jgi:hypothetical protein